jgi:2-amino-4-hydroxy-6-hydroxymethyldihydropteridine diphosphokinase
MVEYMILIALGANLPSPRHGTPRQTCEAALAALTEAGVRVLGCSRWYRSDPVPPSGQPSFVNSVAQVATDLTPADLLAVLHRIENEFGRTRRERNEARIIDLDLLAYGNRISAEGEVPLLPHPRLEERAFVVLPLAELVPEWRHPVSGRTAGEMAVLLPAGQVAEPLE